MARILIVAGHAPTLRNFRGRLIEDLVGRAHEVHAASPGIAADSAIQAWLADRGVTGHDIPMARTGLSVRGDLRSLTALFRVMRQVKPDITLSYTIKPVIWGTLAAWAARVPRRVALITGLGYAFTGDAVGLRGAIRWLARRLYKTALGRCSLVFFQNPDDPADFRRWNILSPCIPVVVVNGSGVDTDEFAPAAPPAGPMRFLLIARLLGDKGIREYARAAARLRADWPAAEFHLVGPLDPNPDGLSEDEVRGWCAAGQLCWQGALEDVRPALAGAHVYVLPSYREGTPRTVLEAMSMSRPIITTDAPGCRETVENGVNGFLVPIRDVDGLCEAMERFLRDPDLVAAMGAQSRRIAQERFDVRKVNAAMITAMEL